MTQVIKANGEIEEFKRDKVINSIHRARIPAELQDQVLTHVESKLYNNIPTAEIYHHILDAFGHSAHPYSKARYSLKQSIMQLGPTGYPFEDYVAKILEEEGYMTQVRQILRGSCISHEVDVIAKKDTQSIMVEAKFHNNPGIRSDVHVSLYTKARFDDVKDHYKFTEAWLITNTKTTSDVLAYAQCVGMKVISWSYPEGESLRDMIERTNLHPITMVTSLSSGQKMTLLQNHIILCKEIAAHHELLDILYLSPEVKQNTVNEVGFICQQEID